MGFWQFATGGGSGGGTGDVVGPASSTDNAIVRYDGATGKLIQDSDVTISDLAAGAVTITAGKGTAITLKNTNPDATTGASVAGDPLAFMAGDAVASTDTAGAAAGGTITLTAGNAARFTSGNANGGNVVFQPGSAIGAGSHGYVQTNGELRIAEVSGTNGKRLSYGTESLRVLNSTGAAWDVATASGFGLTTTGQLTWTSGAVPGASLDTGLERLSAAVVAPTNGSTGNGWINNQAGYCALSSDFTNATATPANLTGLTVTLLTGRKYTFRMSLFVSDSVAGEGVAIDFDGGAATATDFRCHARIYDTALLLSSQTTALATDIAVATITGAGLIEVTGSFTVNAAGTFIPRAWQNSHATGTLTVETGSHLWVEDTSFI